MKFLKRLKPTKWVHSIIKNRKQHEFLENTLRLQTNYMARLTPQAFLRSISVDITAHCNLHCYSCDHFSQFAKKSHYDMAQFEKDIKRLSELSQGFIETISIIGGEPLLNKNCKEYCRIARRYFPYSTIHIITNGILLPKQDESFWETCRDCKIEITPTKYPIGIDWDSIRKRCEDYNITFKFYGEEEKYSFKTCLNPKGDCDPFISFIHCHRANSCTQLSNGKIYPCSVASNISYFNTHFKQNLQTSTFDSIDIHIPTTTYSDILQFLAKPIPFCRYCDTTKTTYQPWLHSKKDIQEYYE